ncbi:Homeobox protein HOY1 [Ilyonectria robusta]
MEFSRVPPQRYTPSILQARMGRAQTRVVKLYRICAVGFDWLRLEVKRGSRLPMRRQGTLVLMRLSLVTASNVSQTPVNVGVINLLNDPLAIENSSSLQQLSPWSTSTGENSLRLAPPVASCDQKEPACSPCEKRRHTCPGYDNPGSMSNDGGLSTSNTGSHFPSESMKLNDQGNTGYTYTPESNLHHRMVSPCEIGIGSQFHTKPPQNTLDIPHPTHIVNSQSESMEKPMQSAVMARKSPGCTTCLKLRIMCDSEQPCLTCFKRGNADKCFYEGRTIHPYQQRSHLFYPPTSTAQENPGDTRLTAGNLSKAASPSNQRANTTSNARNPLTHEQGVELLHQIELLRQTRSQIGEDIDSTPESMRAYLAMKAMEAMESGKGLGGSYLGRIKLSPAVNANMLGSGDHSQSRVLIHHLTCRSISIGTWTRVGQNTMDLIIFYSPDKCTMTYYINNDQAGYKIEYPFSHIKNIFLENNEADPSNQGGIVIELSRPPNFFMDLFPAANDYIQCSDFTEDLQATQCLVHHLGGNPKVLSGQLHKLVSLKDFANRHNLQLSSINRFLNQDRPFTPEHSGPSRITNLRTLVEDDPSRNRWLATDVDAVAGSDDGDFESRILDIQDHQLSVSGFEGSGEVIKPMEKTADARFQCDRCDFQPRGNPKYFKKSLAKHMKRHTKNDSIQALKAKEGINNSDCEDNSHGESLFGVPKHSDYEGNHLNPPNDSLNAPSPRFVASGLYSTEMENDTQATEDTELWHELVKLQRERHENQVSDTPRGLEPDSVEPRDSLGTTDDTKKKATVLEAHDEVAFTDSGYASARNLNRCSLTKPLSELEDTPTSTASLSATNGIDNDDTDTLYSAGTTVAPGKVQTYLAEICGDIYRKLSDCVDVNTWTVVSKALPDLVKAFAVKLGNDSNAQVSRDIMYFIHKRHNHETDNQSPPRQIIPEGMALLDKMALWQSKDAENPTHTAEALDEDLFEGVNDDEDGPIEEVNLPTYCKTIFDSPAYEWFLSNCRKEVMLQWGRSCPRTMTECIRRNLLSRFPTGTISKRYAPKPHELTFVLKWNSLMEHRLQNENFEPSSWPAQSLPIFVALTGSPDEAQALTIKEYMNQTWPTNSAKMFDAIQNAIETAKREEGIQLVSKPEHTSQLAQVPTNEPIAAEVHGTTLRVKTTGPAYFIAECGEQLAWLASALESSSGSLIRHCEPSITKIDVWASSRYNSIYRGECDIAVNVTNVIDSDSPMLGMQSSWQDVVGGHSLVQGYPISRRPRGCAGLELSLDILLHLVQAKGICLDGEQYNVIDDDRGSASTGSLQDEGPRNHGTADIHSAGVIGRQETESILCTSLREEMARSPLSSHDVEGQAPNECPSSSSMELSEARGYFPSGTETESEDVSFDGDQLSISDSSEDIKPLDTNEPLYPILINILHQLLSGFRSMTQCPSGASESNQETGTPICSFGPSRSSAGGSHGQTHLKRKRNEDDKDDADKDGSQGPPQKKTNCDPSDASKKSFACPYLKKDPLEHRDCCTKKLNRIRDVKQHLTRRHTPERYCPMCLTADFANQESWQDHITERRCFSRDPSMLEGISYDQRQRLGKKSDSNLTEEGQWFAIWEIIFPRCPKPLSAYLEAGLSVEMRLFREYSYAHGPALLRQQVLSDPGWIRQDITEEERQGALDQVIAEGIRRLFSSWGSHQQTSSQSSRCRRGTAQQAAQGTPMSSVADSGVGMGSHVSSLETRSQIGGIVPHSNVPEMNYPASRIMDRTGGQISPIPQVTTVGPTPSHDAGWLECLGDMQNLTQYDTGGDEPVLDDPFDALQMDFGSFNS